MTCAPGRNLQRWVKPSVRRPNKTVAPVGFTALAAPASLHGGVGGRFPRSAPSAVCTHILGRLPSRQIALGAERQFLRRPPPTFLQTEAPRANRRGTRRTRRIIFVEGRDRDRSSHNSTPPPHHPSHHPTPPFHCSISISLPSGLPTKVSLSLIIISRMRQSAHLDALTGGEPRQKGFISCDKKISR